MGRNHPPFLQCPSKEVNILSTTLRNGIAVDSSGNFISEVVVDNAATSVDVPASPVAFTQTYSTTAATVPAATSAAVTQTATVDAPAGGTGAAAGGWDTAGNRNTAISTINALRVDVTAIIADNTALRADVLALRKTQNQLIDILQTAGLAA